MSTMGACSLNTSEGENITPQIMVLNSTASSGNVWARFGVLARPQIVLCHSRFQGHGCRLPFFRVVESGGYRMRLFEYFYAPRMS